MEGGEPAEDDLQGVGGSPRGPPEHRQEAPAVRVQIQTGRGRGVVWIKIKGSSTQIHVNVNIVCLCRFIHLKHFNLNACLTLLMKSKIIQNIERRLESGEAIIFSQTSNFLKQNPFVEEHFAQ